MLAARTGRETFLRAFLAHVAAERAGAVLPAALSRRIGDRNLSTRERAALETSLA
ncbi:MAG: hypothetical protein ACRDYY_17000 [Acidimicrobiales bacterium]